MKKEIVSKLSVMGSQGSGRHAVHDGNPQRKVEAHHVARHSTLICVVTRAGGRARNRGGGTAAAHPERHGHDAAGRLAVRAVVPITRQLGQPTSPGLAMPFRSPTASASCAASIGGTTYRRTARCPNASGCCGLCRLENSSGTTMSTRSQPARRRASSSSKGPIG